MIEHYEAKREALQRLIRDTRRREAAATGADREDLAFLGDLWVSLDEDTVRAHHYQHVAIEHEAPPVPRNKGGRPRNPIQPGAIIS